eukprot:CAMPEP_0119030366 /NCGR_PEP_ID=MMETSP1176-20130426/40992_1 /TAXON_ID=265551 /ORGANISM="Synedropsis recta cf, Strain CCMP1620" /LENGTH=737 /DNA_ID=CAMNT_0006986735 /DNA_START=83 /DNA_END=2293 /DNA_ORIENTATION=+
MHSLRLMLFLNAIAGIAASSATDQFFNATTELESIFENCPEGSIFDTIRGIAPVCAPFRAIAGKIASSGSIGRAKGELYLAFCSEEIITDCLQVEGSLLTASTPTSLNEVGCQTFTYTHSTSSGQTKGRYLRRNVLELTSGQEVQVSPKACIVDKVDLVAAIPELYYAYMAELEELGDCVIQTNLLESNSEIQTAFQNVPLEEVDPKDSIVPVYKFDYGDSSNFEAVCATNGGNFASLTFTATCTLDEDFKLTEVKDRPRCYSSKCSENDDESLFENYMLDPTEAFNDSGWNCTGVLVQANAPTVSPVVREEDSFSPSSGSVETLSSNVPSVVSGESPVSSPVASNTPVTSPPTVEELGDCLIETDLLENVSEIRAAFQNIALEEDEPGSILPVSRFDYGNSSNYEAVCARNRGRFVSLTFTATCSLHEASTELMEVKDRPRCYSRSCLESDDESLFKRYTLRPTEAMNGPGWNCTGVLLEQVNSVIVSNEGNASISSPVTDTPTSILSTPSPVVASPITQAPITSAPVFASPSSGSNVEIPSSNVPSIISESPISSPLASKTPVASPPTVEELGDCLIETDLLEDITEIQAAFQKVSLKEGDAGVSVVPVYIFHYGNSSNYESACVKNGGNFVSLTFTSTCTLNGASAELMEVNDRPRCYSRSCLKRDDESLFERYTLRPTESRNGLGWNCTGNLLEQINAPTVSEGTTLSPVTAAPISAAPSVSSRSTGRSVNIW